MVKQVGDGMSGKEDVRFSYHCVPSRGSFVPINEGGTAFVSGVEELPMAAAGGRKL